MPVRRLYIVCEGQTEEEFVRAVLRDHFRDAVAVDVIPILPSNRAGSNLRRHKGGWTSYAKLRDILRGKMEQKHSDETWFTTMLDLYAIPRDFPGLADAPPHPADDRVAALETAFQNDIITDRLWRFTPYLQLHEYEALMLVDVAVIGRCMPDEAATGAPALTADIAGLLPEEVDGGRDTAPSKRIIRHFPSYAGLKTSVGPIVAADIGLPKLRAACPHFDDWLTTLEERCRA
jgi:hypothetical protein